MSGLASGTSLIDSSGNQQVHIVNDDTQPASLFAISAQTGEIVEQTVVLEKIEDAIQDFRAENETALLDVNSELDTITATLLNLDIWSNYPDADVVPLTEDQITNASGTVKSVRICYSGSETIYFQLHDKIEITSFATSTMNGMGYKLSPSFHDLTISFEAALMFRDGIAWALSKNKFIYDVSSEVTRVSMQFMT